MYVLARLLTSVSVISQIWALFQPAADCYHGCCISDVSHLQIWALIQHAAATMAATHTQYRRWYQ